MIRILTVCTGNICRSPYAELFLQSELNRISPESFTIRSAGSHALVGHQMDERSSMKLRDVGVSSDGFVARQLNEHTVIGNDLILALTDEHRQNIVAMSPRLLKRTYTVREFAAVLDELAAMPDVTLPRGNDTTTVGSRWAALLKAAQLARHAARVKLEGNLDVVDPYRQADPVYDRMVEELLPALKTIVEFELIHATEQQSIDSRLEL
jgi:protein-tyrosine phosphatase